MWDEKITILASSSADEVVVFAVRAFIRSCAGFAMRQDRVTLLTFVVRIEEV